MRAVLVLLSLLMSMAVLPVANATVLHRLVEVRCEEQINYFRWRSFETFSDAGFGDHLSSIYKAAPPFDISLARAGFQGPVTYCNFGDANGLVEPTRIDVFVGETDSGNGRLTSSAKLRINGIEMANIDDIWPFSSHPVEHLVEVVGDSGKICTTQFNRRAWNASRSEISDEIEQTMSCQFFRVPQARNDAGKEGE